jgi:hypothetical protein
MKKTAAVITVTTGRKELERCLRGVAHQSYPCTHYVLCDGEDDHAIAQFYDMTRDYANYEARWSFWGNTIGGGNGWLGQRWLAAAPHLITEDVTFFCNDDDWFDEHHVKSIMEKIDQGFDWAYSLRKIYDKDGKYLFDDNCEAIGENHHAWNIEGHHFVDSCMFGMKTNLLKQISIVMNRPGLDIDRHFYAAARNIFPNFTGTNKHTFNFRLGGSCGVQKEFFEQGNAWMLKKFDNKLPWIKT